MKPLRLLIVDDDASVRLALRRLLMAMDQDVVGEAEDGQAGIDSAVRLRPDMVLLDVSMPVMSGFEAARQLHESLPEMPIIFISQHVESTYADEAFRCGAKGYVLKRAATTELPEAIHDAEAGRVFRSPMVATKQR